MNTGMSSTRHLGMHDLLGPARAACSRLATALVAVVLALAVLPVLSFAQDPDAFTLENDGKTLREPPAVAATEKALNPDVVNRLNGRIQACTKAIKIQPEDALAFHHRAVANFKLGNHGRAMDDFAKAVELTPTEASIYYNRAVVYAALGDYEQAVRDATRSIRLDPDFADAYFNRGVDYLASGRIKEALADFEKVTELNAQDSSGYYGRGIAKLKLGSRDAAVTDLEKAADMGNQKAKGFLQGAGLSHPESTETFGAEKR